jgi:nitrite reductase/ring-hydroxylating ferredoxin subunit
MEILKRILGICKTGAPADEGCWSFSNNRITVDLKRTGENLIPGGAVRLEGKGLPGKVLLFHGLDGKFYALKNQCTHIGKRRIDPMIEHDRLKCCSVMGSVFNYKGDVLSGPARKPLTSYPVTIQSDQLLITVT